MMQAAAMEVPVMQVVVAATAPCPHPSVSWLPLEPPYLPPRLCLLLLPLQLLRFRPQPQQSSSRNPPAVPGAAVQPLLRADRPQHQLSGSPLAAAPWRVRRTPRG